ncbi:hypothetical protein GY45DRAFT_198247 [Cubamyces sp. BRFM 1775]|nr:hypothetical protein GY45DRAFT_198247 [Cubamyces sp. BRFM 1775]
MPTGSGVVAVPLSRSLSEGVTAAVASFRRSSCCFCWARARAAGRERQTTTIVETSMAVRTRRMRTRPTMTPDSPRWCRRSALFYLVCEMYMAYLGDEDLELGKCNDIVLASPALEHGANAPQTFARGVSSRRLARSIDSCAYQTCSCPHSMAPAIVGTLPAELSTTLPYLQASQRSSDSQGLSTPLPFGFHSFDWSRSEAV